MKLQLNKFGIFIAVITILSLVFCFYNLYKDIRERQRIETQRREKQRIKDLQLETELSEIEIRAIEQQLEILEFFKKILNNKIKEENNLLIC